MTNRMINLASKTTINQPRVMDALVMIKKQVDMLNMLLLSPIVGLEFGFRHQYV